MLNKLRDFIVRWKFRIGYFSGFLTTFAAVVILSSTIQDKMKLLNISLNYFLVLTIVLIGVIIGSYILDITGFVNSEIDYSNSKNSFVKEFGGKNGSDYKNR